MPTILRLDYLSALTRASADGGPRGLHRVLDHAQKWVASGDWTNTTTGEHTLTATNALIDARDAERRRIYLELLGWTATGTRSPI